MPTSQGQWHHYAITYDRTNDRVEWLVDGEVVAERDVVGAPPGERGPIVKIDSIKVGGGLFTLFGDLLNDRAKAGDREKIPGLDPHYDANFIRPGSEGRIQAIQDYATMNGFASPRPKKRDHMVHASRTIKVNADPNEPKLTRSLVWRGLVMKAENPLPFVPVITACRIVERQGDDQFVREIVDKGDTITEVVTLQPQRDGQVRTHLRPRPRHHPQRNH